MNSFFATLKKRAFATPIDAALSIIVFGGLAYALWLTLDWAVFRAVWSKENVEACGEGVGACRSVIDARHRLILFGLYPYDEHWHSTLACIAIVATVVISCFPWSWKTTRLTTLWIAGFATFYLLMKGTLLGLPTVTTDQ